MDIVGLSYDYYQGVGLYYYENQSILPGISKAPTGSGYALFPNPASEYLILDFTNYPEQSQIISHYNSMGQLMLHEKVKQQNQTLEVEHLPSGAYLVRVGALEQLVMIE